MMMMIVIMMIIVILTITVILVKPAVAARWLDRLPDGGSGTNGVVAEVPRFPPMSFRGKRWSNFNKSIIAKCGNVCALRTKYGKMCGFVALL